ncbi:hypothetical protein HAX54_007295 [Datura stramonium]|uniref:Uncharacterized protein n=1 Tax=Datura stramonium TaxID=4076 RepID=A0ABS8TBJ1_DATST|nr:hypothetical protein [Datura stramonium]
MIKEKTGHRVQIHSEESMGCVDDPTHLGNDLALAWLEVHKSTPEATKISFSSWNPPYQSFHCFSLIVLPSSPFSTLCLHHAVLPQPEARASLVVGDKSTTPPLSKWIMELKEVMSNLILPSHTFLISNPLQVNLRVTHSEDVHG